MVEVILNRLQDIQCEGQGSPDVLREAQMDGMQSCDKEGARLCFKSLALPIQKRLRCCIEYAQMLACLEPLTEQCCYGLRTKRTVKSMSLLNPMQIDTQANRSGSSQLPKNMLLLDHCSHEIFPMGWISADMQCKPAKCPYIWPEYTKEVCNAMVERK